MRIPKQRLALAWLLVCLSLASEFCAWSACAANANNGRRIAQARCSPCHIVVPNQRQELAKSRRLKTSEAEGVQCRNAGVFDPCPSSANELNLHQRGGGGLGSLYRLFAQIAHAPVQVRGTARAELRKIPGLAGQ
jgi:hypothetical protein